MILVLAVVGVYTLSNGTFEVWLMIVFGLIGYVLTRMGFPLAPIILGLILGDMAEMQLRLTLMISQGDWSALFASTISLIIAGLTVLILSWPVIRHVMDRRKARKAGAP